MTNLLIRLFTGNSNDVNNTKVRGRYGILAGAVNILCNVALFLAKLAMGLLSGSIAVIADAVNNLSDAGSSLVTLVGFKLAAQPADKEHPFGHGRFEYISGLVISFLIMLVGIEFGKTSIEKIIHPEAVTFSYVVLGTLVLSIGVKLWMSHFNATIGKRIGSVAMQASAADSRNDVLVTGATLISIIVAKFTDFPVDGYIGLAVSAFVLYSGYGIAKDTINPLLGEAPDPEVIERIKDSILSNEQLSGVHEIVVHNYGPGKSVASAHAEMTHNCDIITAHNVIDVVEQEIYSQYGIEIVIHLDPVIIPPQDTATPQT